jgi:broad specificity phosphatase PhoE
LSEWLNPDWMSERPQLQPDELLAKEYPRIDWSYTSKIIPEYPESEDTVNKRTSDISRKLIQEFSEDILLVGHSASVLGATRGLVEGNPYVNTCLCCLIKLVRYDDIWQLELDDT